MILKKIVNRLLSFGCTCDHKKGCEEGPCYDFCGCAHCWSGWSDLTWWEKVKNRIKHVAYQERYDRRGAEEGPEALEKNA